MSSLPNTPVNSHRTVLAVLPWTIALVAFGAMQIGLWTRERDGQTCCCATPTLAAPVPQPAESSVELTTSPSATTDWDEAVRCDGDTCTVARIPRHSLAQRGQQARQGRLVPVVRDGEFMGLKVYGVRRHNLPRQLGFQSGDMLLGPSGEQPEQLARIVSFYDWLAQQSDVRLTLERDGKRLTRRIRVVDELEGT